MSLHTRALAPSGIEIVDQSLGDLSDEQVVDLRAALGIQGFAVFRKQKIDDQQFTDFLKRLGPLTFTVGERAVEKHRMLNVVSNIGRSSPPRSVFHTDTSYVSRPPAYTALRAVQLPKSGGETLFTDQYAAFESLPSWLVKRLRGARVLHIASGVTLNESDESQCWHPLFRRHPISGRVALFLSTPQRCVEIEGYDRKMAERIIAALYRHSITRNPIYRHRWQPGDVVIWDDRCTLHRADHSQVQGDRVLHRGLIRGDRPIAA